MLSATRDEDRQTDTGALASEGLVRLVPLPVEAVGSSIHGTQRFGYQHMIGKVERAGKSDLAF
jgi:hypothetical protein